jgi:hypothetical protein
MLLFLDQNKIICFETAIFQNSQTVDNKSLCPNGFYPIKFNFEITWSR